MTELLLAQRVRVANAARAAMAATPDNDPGYEQLRQHYQLAQRLLWQALVEAG
jgi:hypothetical protein